MTLLTFCLISVLASLLGRNPDNKKNVLISYIPLLIYFIVKNEVLTLNLVSILIPTFITYAYVLVKTPRVTKGLKNVLIFTPWCIVNFCQMQTLLELTIFLVGVNLIAFSIGEEETFNDKKLIQYESGHILAMSVFGFILMIFSVLTFGDISLKQSLEVGHFYEILQFLLIAFLFCSLEAFGSFSKTENLLKKLNQTNQNIYLFLKLVALPFVIVSNLKLIIDSPFVAASEYMILLVLIAVILTFILDLKRTCFDIKSYSIAKFNLLNLILIYALVEEFTVVLLSLLLFLNYSIFLVIKNFKLSQNKSSFIKVFFLVAPVSPLFYVKTLYYASATKLMSPLLIIIFTMFLFLPLMFTHKLEKLEQ